MTSLILALTAILGPLTGTTSLDQDRAYWHAAHTWQTRQPTSYYPYTIAFLLLAAILTKHHWRPPAPLTPSGESSGGTGRSEWNRRL